MSRLSRVLMGVLVALGLVQVAVTPAQAAVPNRWGYAYVNVPSGVPSLAHQAGSWPVGFNVSVLPGIPGETVVRFPQIAGPGGVVHATAVYDGPVICQVAKWVPIGTDIIAYVRCHQFGTGTPQAVPFTVTYSESTGVMGGPATAAFGYVHYNAGIVTQYNSALVGNIVSVLGVGWYKVTMPGLGSSSAAGNIQVTAVNDLVPARCKVVNWVPSGGAQQAEVRCFDAANTPQNSGFSFTYQRERNINGRWVPPKAFAYTFDQNPSNPGPYAPAAGLNYNSQGAINTVQSSGTGLRMITFPKVGYPIDHVQVTASANNPAYCNIQMPWFTSGGIAIVRNVVCWVGTTRVNNTSFVSYTSTA